MLNARRLFVAVAILSLGLIGGSFTACNRPTGPTSDNLPLPSTASPNKTVDNKGAIAPANDSTAEAKKLLNEVAAAYSSAQSYADAGKLVVSFRAGEQTQARPFDYATTFVRPNKIRIHCYGATIIGNEKDFHATLANLTKQVLTLKSPLVFDESVLRGDPILASALNEGGLGGAPLLPALLTDPKLIDEIFLKPAKQLRLLEPETIDGQKYDRVLVSFDAPAPASPLKSSPEIPAEGLTGEFIFSIDRATKTLRRLEMPMHPATRKQFEDNGGKDVHMFADFIGAKLNSEIPPAAFQFDMSADAKPVKRFVWEIPPHAPSELLGKRVGDFELVAANGDKITRDSLAGKTVVLDFWSQGFEPSAQKMPLLAQVAEQYKDNDKVAFYAVNIEGPTAKAEALQQVLKEWKGNLSLARDLNDQASKVFGEKPFPFYVVLGPDGKVQDFAAGMNPNLAIELPQTIKKILDGENTFENAQTRFVVAQKNYDDTLRRANEGEGTTIQEIPKIEIALRSEPAKLKLTKLWQADGLKGIPGNLLLVPQADAPPKIVVIDEWRSVVEYDGSGKLLARHDLQLPPELVVSFLRMAVDSQGKRTFVAFANDMPQLFIFDEQWNKIATYPEGERVGIADVQIADLSGTGEPTLLVGYWDAIGVQGVSLAGKRLWGNRVMQTAFRLAISAKDAEGKRNVLCVNGSETIGPFNNEGKAGEFVNLPGRMIEWIASEDLGQEGQTKTVLISAHDPQKSHFIGIDDNGREQWTYPTIKGTPQKPVERVVSGKLADGRGVWLLAVADGSIHFVLPDGRLLDKFNYGSELTGMALGVFDGKNVLIVSSKDSLTAWQVEE